MTTVRRSSSRWMVAAVAIIIVVVVAASYFASGDPDGLERVADDHGFLGTGRDNPFSILADYVFPGLDGPIATVVAGIIGVAVVFGIVWLFGRLLVRRRSPEA
jgi:type IV secretory pathway VirB2 component (pilin)